MSNAVLVLGQPGAGKSCSMRNLDFKETFLINVLGKPLSFKVPSGAITDIQKVVGDDGSIQFSGNHFASANWSDVIKVISVVNERMPHIKTLVLDDWQYILSSEFMNRVAEKGYEKFSEIGLHGWETFKALLNVRSDLQVFVLAHSDQDMAGRNKIKTIGKLLDEKVSLEGLFSIVLHARTVDSKYIFQTQGDDFYLAKSPMQMFDELYIDNDLLAVKDKIKEYYS